MHLHSRSSLTDLILKIKICSSLRPTNHIMIALVSMIYKESDTFCCPDSQHQELTA